MIILTGRIPEVGTFFRGFGLSVLRIDPWCQIDSGVSFEPNISQGSGNWT